MQYSKNHRVNMKFSIYVVCVFLSVIPAAVPSESDIWKLVTGDPKIWNCITTLDEECVTSLGKKPVEELFKVNEFRLGKFVSIEKMKDVSSEKRDALEDIWDLGELMEAGVEYVKSHALKFTLGNLDARMFASPTKPESMELTVEARKIGNRGQAQKIYRVVIPLLIGFKITGLVIFGLVAVKFFLLKATMLANTALMVAGGIVMKKMYDHGMGILSHHQTLLTSHHTMPSFYANNHDFSGYGYGSGASHGFGNFGGAGYETSEVAESVPVPDIASQDLHGQFSNHAIALAALNKTLMQQHQQPKRRWAHKWANFHR